MSIPSRLLAATLCLPAPALAQDIEGLPTERTMLIPPGAWVDLDTGVLLPRPTLQKAKADLQFDRDGKSFIAAPLHGGMPAGANATEPGDDWNNERRRIDWRRETTLILFVRTDREAVARVSLTVVDPYSTGSAVLTWVLAPSALASFLPAPGNLASNWSAPGLEVSWTGDAPNYLVELETGGEVQKQTTAAPRIVFADLSPDAVHRVRVRGLLGNGAVTLPAETVQHGRRRPPSRGVVEYPANWCDQTGGLSLLRGSAAVDDGDVVFYYYGVYVPGGGVQKLGVGGDCYRHTASLPDSGYLPVYGRIDDRDVLGIRTADGRYAKLWLDMAPGSIHDGMRVHFTFLADGRRRMLAAPAECASSLTDAGLRLMWPAVDGALHYRLQTPGMARPLATPDTTAVLPQLAANRMHVVELVAVGADGEESDAHVAHVHTYDAGYRVGSFTLECQRAGYSLVDAAKMELRADHTPPPELDLQFDGGAGNYNGMGFLTPHGAAGCGELQFGEFPEPRAEPKFEPHWYSDDRKPGFERFLVRTGDGGLASVRIRVRDSRAVFDYVLRLPKK